MKRSIFLTISLTLALAACAGGKSVGEKFDFPESNRPSVSPTPSAKPTAVKKTTNPTPTPTQTQKGQDYCKFRPQQGGDITVVIKSVNTSFEPNDIFVFQGCKVTFKNLDRERAHSWVSGSGTDPGNDGSVWRSPVLQYNKTFVLDTSDIDPATYPCHDGEVPYGVVCSLTVGATS